MSEKKYEKKIEFQQKMISRQSEQIEDLKSQNEKLKLELQGKDRLINSIIPLKDELTRSIAEVKNNKEEYKKIIKELRKMKEIMNEEVFKGRWWLIKLLLK